MVLNDPIDKCFLRNSILVLALNELTSEQISSYLHYISKTMTVKTLSIHLPKFLHFQISVNVKRLSKFDF